MLTERSIKDIGEVKRHDITVATATTPKTGVTYEYPMFVDVEELEQVDGISLINLLNRRLKDDYRNMANTAPNKAAVKKARAIEIKADDAMSDAEKFAAMAKLLGA